MEKIRHIDLLLLGKKIAFYYLSFYLLSAVANGLSSPVKTENIADWENYFTEITLPITKSSYNDSSLLEVEHYFGDSLVQLTPPLACQSIGRVRKYFLDAFNSNGYSISYDSPSNDDVRCSTYSKSNGDNKKVTRICLNIETYFGKCVVTAAAFGMELEGSDDYYEEVEERRDEYISDTLLIIGQAIHDLSEN